MIAVMSLDCRILQDFRSDASTTGWAIGSTGSEAVALAPVAYLPYSSLCAEELRRHRELGA